MGYVMKTLQTLQDDFGFNSIIECMLWSEADSLEDYDLEFDFDSVHESVITSLVEKYNQFLDTTVTIIPSDFIVDWEQIGHDFWLTCKGHGAGFWDRPELEYGNIGRQLTKVCETISIGEVLAHNGSLYLS